MSVSRKRFRVEQAIVGDVPMSMSDVAEGDVGPMHREIMAELRAIRAQMAAPARSGAPETTEALIAREVAESQALRSCWPGSSVRRWRRRRLETSIRRSEPPAW